MIRVAIVDDESREIDILQTYFEKIQTEICEEIRVQSFLSGEALLEAYSYSFDLICLDIELGGKDGISIAREIRGVDEETILLFVTNMAQMAICGYEVRALDFLVKPLSYFSFSMKIRNAVQMIHNRKSKNLILHTDGGLLKVTTSQLYYIEVDRHYLYYHTTKGVFKQKAALKDLEDELEGLSFKRCNHCYLVNLKHVDGVEKDDIRIGGERLKISRPKRKDFLQSLANYLGGVNI